MTLAAMLRHRMLVEIYGNIREEGLDFSRCDGIESAFDISFFHVGFIPSQGTPTRRLLGSNFQARRYRMERSKVGSVAIITRMQALSQAICIALSRRRKLPFLSRAKWFAVQLGPQSIPAIHIKLVRYGAYAPWPCRFFRHPLAREADRRAIL